MSGLENALASLRQAATAPSLNTEAAFTALSAAKKHLLLSGAYGSPSSPSTPADKSILLAAREAFELACLICVRSGRIDELDRHYGLLRPYYYASFMANLPASTRREETTYLYLLSCLANTPPLLADFFSEVELLSPQDLESPLLKAAIQIEHSIETGSYLLLASKALPLPELSGIFAAKIGQSARESAADAIELAYTHLPIQRLSALLGNASSSEVENLVTTRGWKVKDGIAVFDRQEPAVSSVQVNKDTIDLLVSIASSIEQAM